MFRDWMSVLLGDFSHSKVGNLFRKKQIEKISHHANPNVLSGPIRIDSLLCLSGYILSINDI